MKKFTEKKMIVSLEAELYKDIKKRAIDNAMTLKEWLTQAIMLKIAQEEKYK